MFVWFEVLNLALLWFCLFDGVLFLSWKLLAK